MQGCHIEAVTLSLEQGVRVPVRYSYFVHSQYSVQIVEENVAYLSRFETRSDDAFAPNTTTLPVTAGTRIRLYRPKLKSTNTHHGERFERRR